MGRTIEWTRTRAAALSSAAVFLATTLVLAAPVAAQSCIPPPPGITSWWPADGNGLDIIGGHTAVLQNGAGYGPGLVGQAFQLDGINDFVSVAPDPGLDFGGGDFTLDYWVNFNTTAGEQVMIEKWIQKANGDGEGWTLTKPSDFFRLATSGLGNGEGDADSPSLHLQTGTWMHVAARRMGGSAAVFVNGVQVAASSSPYNLNSSASLKFGHRGDPTDTPGSTDTREFFLNGRIDEVHLFVGRALSDAEIQAIYAAGSGGLCQPTPVCGNGVVEAGEQCDDGNTVDGDSCESNCTLSCGNGILESLETCDDGNLTDGDGCDSNCTPTGCGNGIVTAGETCDDGNTVNGDGCDNNCTPTGCGNGIVTPPEMCDDGNAVDGDGCESDCTITPVMQLVPPGGTATTDPLANGATPSFPVQTAITSPNGGTISIAPPSSTSTLSTVSVVGTQFQIDAPAATAADPLTIVLTVDPSAIPAGVDPTRLSVTRNNSLIADCTGAPGVASPDPCISSRTLLMDGDVQLSVLTSHASLWSVVVPRLARPQRSCITGSDAAGIKVLKTQATDDLACLKAGAKGTEPNPQACLTADTNGKLAAAMQKTTMFTGAHCAPAPPFGLSADTTINTAAQQTELGIMSDLFGTNLNAAVATNPTAAACQAAVLQKVDQLLQKEAALFDKCLSSGLGGHPAPIVSAPQVASCSDAITADAKGSIAKAVDALNKALVTTCSGLDLGTLLPGACSGAGVKLSCLRTHAQCRLCKLFNAMDAVSGNCDRFDNGLIDNSCP